MNIQHILAVKIANILDADTNSEVEEKALLVYGIEIFLNELFKVIVIWAMAAMLGALDITVIGTIFLLMLRRYSGGKHCTSNLKCYLVTALAIFILPISIINLEIPYIVSILAIMIESGFFYYSLSKNKSKRKSLFIVFYLGLALVFGIGGIRYVNAMLIVALVVIVAIDRKMIKGEPSGSPLLWFDLRIMDALS